MTEFSFPGPGDEEYDKIMDAFYAAFPDVGVRDKEREQALLDSIRNDPNTKRMIEDIADQMEKLVEKAIFNPLANDPILKTSGESLIEEAESFLKEQE